jgi:hypothetical protein
VVITVRVTTNDCRDGPDTVLWSTGEIWKLPRALQTERPQGETKWTSSQNFRGSRSSTLPRSVVFAIPDLPWMGVVQLVGAGCAWVANKGSER